MGNIRPSHDMRQGARNHGGDLLVFAARVAVAAMHTYADLTRPKGVAGKNPSPCTIADKRNEGLWVNQLFKFEIRFGHLLWIDQANAGDMGPPEIP
jgi:hypothetical protein